MVSVHCGWRKACICDCLFFLIYVIFPSSAQEALKLLAVSFSPTNTVNLPSASAPPSLSKPHSPLTLLPGTPDTLASVQLLTSRYRRRPVALEEMEYIQVREHLLGGELVFF